jgi:hypothetical protein
LGQHSIWAASSPDLKSWGNHRLVVTPRQGSWDDTKVGGGAAPVRVHYGKEDGWLAIYHGVTGTPPTYALGALLLNRHDPSKVRGRSREPIDPEPPAKKFGMRCGVVGRNFGFIPSMVLRNDRVCGKLSRSKRVINTFASKRLHHSRCVTHKEERTLRSGNWCACQRSDRSPRMFGRNPETRFRPTAQGRHLAWKTDQAHVQFAVPDRGLAGIAARQELENDAISEVVWQWQVSLQRNALFRASRKQVAEPGDGRVPTISTDKHSRLEGFSRRSNRPILSPRARAS